MHQVNLIFFYNKPSYREKIIEKATITVSDDSENSY